jgi:hypothetical protein
LLQAAPDGAAPQEDFLPGAIQPCGIASVAWSALIAFDDGLKRKPQSLEDFKKIIFGQIIHCGLKAAWFHLIFAPLSANNVLSTDRWQCASFSQ